MNLNDVILDEHIAEIIKKRADDGGYFDYLLVCDGSGTVVGSPSGHHSVIFNLRTNEVVELTSAHSNGTNNFAELNTFVMAFWWLQNKHPDGDLVILCVSDSELTVKCGQGKYERKANKLLWAAIDQFEEKNSLWWVHRPRNSNAVMQHCDKKAGEARRMFLYLGPNEGNK